MTTRHRPDGLTKCDCPRPRWLEVRERRDVAGRVNFG